MPGGPADWIAHRRRVGDFYGALLATGLWTPIAGPLVIALSTWGILVQQADPHPGILLAAIGVALALVGPGALSLMPGSLAGRESTSKSIDQMIIGGRSAHRVVISFSPIEGCFIPPQRGVPGTHDAV